MVVVVCVYSLQLVVVIVSVMNNTHNKLKDTPPLQRSALISGWDFFGNDLKCCFAVRKLETSLFHY